MRDLSAFIPAWLPPLIVASLAPLSLHLGERWSWTPGAVPLVLLSLPVVIAALGVRTWPAMGTILPAAALCLADAALRGAAEPHRWQFATLAGTALLGMGGFILMMNQQLRHQLRQLQPRNRDDSGYLAEHSRAWRNADRTSAVQEDSANLSDEENVSAPLLRALQDLSRRLSSDLDLESLIPTIGGIAEQVLRCGRCQVYLWDSRTYTLKRAIPGSYRGEENSVPGPLRGMTGWVISERRLLTRADVHQNSTLRSLLDAEADPPEAVAPLLVGGELLGLIVLHDRATPSSHFDRLLHVVANLSALTLKNAQLYRRIEEMSRRDGLTGLLNHTSFHEKLLSLAREADELARPVTVVIGKVDQFKRFNEAHGHQAGDTVLAEVARCWQAVLPESAVIARYGDDEFIAALPGNETLRGYELAELLRQHLEQFPLMFEGNELKVTASFGIAEYRRHARSLEEVVRLAEGALDKAGQQGGNCVAAHSDINLPPHLPRS